MHEPHANRSSIPNEPHAPVELFCGKRNFRKRQAFRPRRRPIVHQGNTQAAIDHDRNRFERIKFEPLAGANAGVTELTGDAAKSPISFSNTEKTFMTALGYRF